MTPGLPATGLVGRRLPVRMGRGAGVGGGLGTIVLLLVGLYFGVDLTAFLGGGTTQLDTGGGQLQLPSPRPDQGAHQPKPPPHAGGLQAPGAGAKPDELKDFISVVLADTEDTWGEIFRQGKQRYQEPKLVLFSGRGTLRLRLRRGRHGTLLLPRGPQGLYRPVLL